MTKRLVSALVCAVLFRVFGDTEVLSVTLRRGLSFRCNGVALINSRQGWAI